MELIVSLGIGLLAACGIFLILRPTSFSVVLGLTLLSYAVNALIFVGGRLAAQSPTLVAPGTEGFGGRVHGLVEVRPGTDRRLPDDLFGVGRVANVGVTVSRDRLTANRHVIALAHCLGPLSQVFK